MNLKQFNDLYPDEKASRDFFASRKWKNDEAICPRCQDDVSSLFADGWRRKCSNCHSIFNPLTGTILQGTRISGRRWLLAIYFATELKPGVSATLLSEVLEVTPVTAQRMLRILKSKLALEVK